MKPIRRTRSDTTRKVIVEAIMRNGCFVWDIGWPCDLLVYRVRDKRWFTMELKTPRNKKGEPRLDKRQVEQGTFVSLTGTPYITSPEAALEYLR
jgi:hypothetical protein